MKIEQPLIPARFVDRPNRFITLVEIEGQTVTSHLPDPGRLKELLVPGADIFVRPVLGKSKRKTRFSTVMVKIKSGNSYRYISLVSALPNQFVKECIIKKLLPFYSAFKLIRAEVPIGKHRFDFLLADRQGRDYYLEVKSVTFVEKGVAKFPDAVTKRGADHAKALREMTKKEIRTGILFICQRDDAVKFRPMWSRDPVLWTGFV